jgi:hypothetical protein
MATYRNHPIWPKPAALIAHIAGGRRRRGDRLAGLREFIPGVRFADRIEVITRDARAAAAWTRLSQTLGDTGRTDGIFLHRNYAPRKPCNISGQILVQNP